MMIVSEDSGPGEGARRRGGDLHLEAWHFFRMTSDSVTERSKCPNGQFSMLGNYTLMQGSSTLYTL